MPAARPAPSSQQAGHQLVGEQRGLVVDLVEDHMPHHYGVRSGIRSLKDGVEALTEAVESGEITEERIDESVRWRRQAALSRPALRAPT